MRRVTVAAAIAAVAVLAGCGGARTPVSGAPPPGPAASGDADFPAVATPLSSAPPRLAGLWRPYGVTVIPPASVVDSATGVAAAIPVANHSGGAFSDAQVQQFAVDDMRDQLLVGWAGEHLQPALSAHLAGELFLVGPDAFALADGTALHYPPCGLVPTGFVVLPPTPGFDAELTGRNQEITPGAFPVRLSFTGCAVTGTTRSGATVTVDPATGPATIVVDDVLRHDPVLGDVLFAEGATSCPDPAATALCSG